MNVKKAPAILPVILSLIFLCGLNALLSQPADKAVYLRANQIGYLPEDDKIAIAFSHQSLPNARFEIIDAVSGKRVWGPQKLGSNAGAYGSFAYQ